MRHTFLLEPGDWQVTGHYFDRDGSKFPVSGESHITHDKASWASEGEIRIGTDGDRVMANRYDIVPMPAGADHTTWVCTDPTEGTIRGAISVVDDCVISAFQSEGGEYRGVDVLRKTRQEYKSRGFAMKDGVKLSSWALSIRKSP